MKEEVNHSFDPKDSNYFENFCAACDYFGTLDCPFLSIVNENTRWKHIGCNNFWD